MRRLQQRRSIARFLCFLMILEMFVASPNVAEAKSEGIKRGNTKNISAEYDEPQMTITLYDPTKPENTKVVSSTVPSWATVSKPGYNTASFRVTFSKNTTGKDRTATIRFTDGTYNWYAKITQKKYTAPPTTPPTTPPTKEPTKKVTTKPTQKPTPVPTKTPTKAPTSTHTPMPELTASEASLGFPADGATKTVTISGYTGTLRADRNDTWFTVSVSGGTISVTATKNTSTARASYVDVTDTGSGRSVRIQVTQAAPVLNLTPTKGPTNTPTPTPLPAETLPVSRRVIDFGYQGGQDTLSLSGNGYNLTFSFQDNPSIPSGWVGMIYDGNTIKIKVERNKDYTARSMKVKITDTKTNQYAYVTINQKAAPKPPTPTPFLIAKQNKLSFNSKSCEETVFIEGVQGKLAFSYSWSPNTVTGWVDTKQEEAGMVRFFIAENLSINPREVTVTIKDEKTKKTTNVTIAQEGMPNTVVVSNTVLKADKVYLQFGIMEESETVTVSGKKGELRVNRGEGNDWIFAEVNGNKVKIKVAVNKGEERKGFVDVTDTGNGQRLHLTIVQKGIESVFSTEEKRYTVEAQGGTMYVKTVTSPNSITIKFRDEKTKNWLNVSKEDGMFKFEIKANTTAESRSAKVDLSVNGSSASGATIEIIQEGAFVLNRNYVGAPSDPLCIYPKPGESYGSLPSPGKRSGFEFDGWYTSPSGGEKVGAYTKYDGKINMLYAHWKVIVSFPDFSDMNVQYHEISAYEGKLITIPSTLIKELGYYGFHVSGWTRNPSGHKIDNGNANAYQLPKNLGGAKVSLYAINTEGLTFAEYYEKYLKNPDYANTVRVTNIALDVAKEAAVRALEFPIEVGDDIEAWYSIGTAIGGKISGKDKDYNWIISGVEIAPGETGFVMENFLSPPYEKEQSDKNREMNEAMVKDLKENSDELSGYINGQKRTEINQIKVGDMTFGQAGCGIIARTKSF